MKARPWANGSAALCMSMVLCGWNDGSVGPLIPSLQEYYGVSRPTGQMVAM